MAVDRVCESSDLKSVADAIRAKGSTSSPLTFPTGFVTAIQDIPTGGGNVFVKTVEMSSAITQQWNTMISEDAFLAQHFNDQNLFAVALPCGAMIETTSAFWTMGSVHANFVLNQQSSQQTYGQQSTFKPSTASSAGSTFGLPLQSAPQENGALKVDSTGSLSIYSTSTARISSGTWVIVYGLKQ